MPSLLFCLCFLLPHLLSLPLFFSLLCHVILDLLQSKVYARAIKQNVLGYYRNLGTERVLRLVKTHMGKCIFSPELKSYLITQWNCTTIGLCRCRKTNQWVGSGAARTFGDDTRQIPAETGGVSGYISGRFAIGSSGLLRLKPRLSRAATWHGKVRSTRSVSQGTEVTIVTQYVPYRYSTRTASCKDAYGNWI